MENENLNSIIPRTPEADRQREELQKQAYKLSEHLKKTGVRAEEAKPVDNVLEMPKQKEILKQKKKAA